MNTLTDRKQFIGSSDAAAILGLSRWKTQLEVWAEKVGRIVPEDISDKLQVKLGNRLEETVAELFMEETGKKVRRVNKPQIHPDYPFISCQIDRDVVGEDAILECKTASAWKAKEWEGEEIPQEYIIQVVHQLAVTGAAVGYIAVLIGNQEFKWKAIYRDNPTTKSLIDKEVEFWNSYVVPSVMPLQIAHNDGSVLYDLFPVADTNKDVILPDTANVLIEQIEAMSSEKDLLEKDIEKNKNELKALLGDAESGTTRINRVTWKVQNTNRIDTERFKKENEELYKAYIKTTTTRVLRHSKIKKEN